MKPRSRAPSSADDRPEMLRTMDLALGEKYECEFAGSVDEARTRLAEEDFQLALCDVHAAGELALALAEEILVEHPGAAVILVTGEDSPQVADRAFEVGVHGYLVEPFWPGQLLITVMNALRWRELEIAKSAYNRNELAASQREAIDELRLSREETVERLARAIDLHDASTGEHVNRIGLIAEFLAGKLGVEAAEIELLRIAAPMHDVGKIGISDDILRKPGPLTAAERAVMERHTVIGHEILSDSKSALLRVAATIALTHHERWDGGGYPRGLSGEEIPLAGRITAVADVFDALLSDRCYRPAMGVDVAVELLEQGRGTQFDPRVLAALLDNLDEALEMRV